MNNSVDTDLVCQMLRLWSYRFGDSVAVKFYQNGSCDLVDWKNDLIRTAKSFDDLIKSCPPCIHPKEKQRRGILWGEYTGHIICDLCGAQIS